MRIALGADHAGFELKQHLKERLAERGLEVFDCGTHGTASTDYPDWAAAVAARVADGAADRGLLVCGSGVGMAIAANRRRGVRAVATGDLATVRLARAHNDANVLALGARLVAPPLAETLVEAFLDGLYEGGRHDRRVHKLDGDPR